MSLWSEYREALCGTKFLEYEWGFLSYSELPDVPDCLLVEDCFVRPEARKQGRGRELIKEVSDIGRKAGKARLVCSVRVTFKGCAASLAAQLAVGFVPHGLEGDRIWLSRLIEPEEKV